MTPILPCFIPSSNRASFVAFGALFLAHSTQAALPPNFVNQTIASGFTNPVGVTFDAPTGRMFIVEKGGRVWIQQDGNTLSTPFIDLVDEVHNAGDKGMLGIALDPDFSTNQYVYLLYTVDPVYGQPDEPDDAIAFGRLTRYTADGNVADLASRTILLADIAQDGFPSCSVTHSIGTVKFGLDGTLFVGGGEGAHPEFIDGGQNILPNDALCDSTFGPDQNIGALRSQSLLSLGGKILRIDPGTGLGLPSNPFWDGDPTSFASRIWVKGLRNPYRFNIRPGSAGSGTLYICDVGWMQWEELNVAYGGENFGWPCWEGNPQQPNYYFDSLTGPACQAIPPGSVTSPLVSWNHTNPNPIGFIGNAATGTAFYTGTSYPPEYHGRCFFIDLGQSWMKVATVTEDDQLVSIQPFGETLTLPVDLQTHPENGDLVFVTVFEGRVRRIRYVVGNAPPNAIASANPTVGAPPLAVQFSSNGTNDPNGGAFSLLWNFGDGTAETSTPNPMHMYSTVGTFVARLIASDPGGLADSAYVTIVTENDPPTVTIQNPPNGYLFEPGVPIILSADANDPKSGDDLDWLWTAVLIHNEHVHPGWFTSDEVSPLFTPTDHGGPGDRYSYRISVEVTDPLGGVAADSVVIVPPSLGSNVSPVPQFSVSTHEGEEPLVVSFDATDSVDPDGDLLDFAWRFGDGTIGTGETTTHVFGSWGLFTVELLVSDPFLGVDSTTCAIRVEPSGLLASWSFDEGVGATVDDATANDRDGALSGTGYSWVPGVRATGLDFLGTDALLTTSESFLSNRAAFTLTGWIRPHSTISSTGIVGQLDAIGMGFDTGAMFGVRTSLGGEELALYSFPMNEWHHVATTGSGTSLRVYFDGTVASSGTYITGDYGSSSSPVNVGGGIFDATGDHAHATVDDMRIFGRALAPPEIAFLATAPPPNFTPVADAGEDVTVTIGEPTALWGRVTDDALPAPPGQVTTLWTQVSGPGAASIFEPDRRFTHATFPEPGDYVLSFSGSDGELTAADEIVVHALTPTGSGDLPATIVDGFRRVGPNPLREKGTISYGVARNGVQVKLDVHDVSGRRVRTLVQGPAERGEHRVTWDGRDAAGRGVGAGIYFVVLDVGGRRFTKKLVVIR